MISQDYILQMSIDLIKENGFILKIARSRWYPAKTLMDTDYTDDIAFPANTPTQANSLLHRLEQAAGGISLHVNEDKTEYMCFNQEGDISTLNGGSLKLVDKFMYLSSSISSAESDINIWLAQAWTTIDRLLIIWKSDLSDKIKCNFFQTVVVSILLYGCTTWTLIKHIEKKLDRNCTRMLQTILNKSWKQHPTKQQLYGHLPPIAKTIHIRWTRYVRHCWRSKDELINNVLLWTPSRRCASVGRPTRTYLQWFCRDVGCSLEEAIDNRDKWQESQGNLC